ncbi:MAG: glutamyl-tRNA amidotransferase [Deltaproteobacteria bacterium CG11_big_fil_rev_8_21_14_0_20_45_16]|nr:MAG: glutamyl-tRNA amidotransferase [Deltaproteobacteria bacterium CG11_big_fil_rev_8_21_14_0_20_45_16]
MGAFDTQIAEQIKDAMRSKDQLRLDTLRALKSALKYKLIELKKPELTQDEYLQVFRALIKQRQEAADQFDKAGAKDRAEKERAELAIVQKFLPEPLSALELESLVLTVIKDLGASSIKEMGAVMKEANVRAQGRADGRSLSELVKQKLSA